MSLASVYVVEVDRKVPPKEEPPAIFVFHDGKEATAKYNEMVRDYGLVNRKKGPVWMWEM